MGSRSSAEEDEMKLIKMPLLSSPRPRTKGGIKALPFIIANEALERLASQGLQPNMVLYLTQEFGLQAAGAATAINLWSAATNFMPLVGAFIADSYTGRFPMIAFGSVVSLLGMIVLWVTTIDIPQAKPACSGSGCTSISPSQGSTSHLLYLLYFSFGLMAIGAGGIRSASVAFGADQIDKRGISTNNIANNSTDNNANNSTDDNVNNSTNDNANKSTLRKFFIWYYVAYTVSLLLGASFVVYIQEHYGWKVGFGVPVLFMLLSTILFLLASRIYIKYKVNKNLIAGLAQVIVASFRNRSINLPSSGTSEIHYYIEGSSMLRPTENLRCLNKACIIRDSEQNLTPDGKSVDPWSVCTVDQVEELKSLIKVMPIWSTAIFMSVMMSQGSFPVLQAKTMDRHIFKNFEIPAGSITTIFSIVSMGLWVYLYVRVLIPLLSKIKGRPVILNPKDRMGLGILFSCFSMCVAAIVEMVRRNIAIKEGYSDNPQAVVHMSAMWLVPQSVLMGFAEAFSFIAQIEFFYAELPRSMSSIASCLFTLGMSAGNLVASLIINIVDDVTKRGNRESWVATNINKGHYDYYCWLLACLSFANLLYFAVCQKAYGPCKAERINNSTVEDGVVSQES